MDKPFGDKLRDAAQSKNLATLEEKIRELIPQLEDIFSGMADEGQTYKGHNLLEEGQWLKNLLLTKDLVENSKAWALLQARAKELNVCIRLYEHHGYELNVTFHLNETFDGKQFVPDKSSTGPSIIV
ncbi:MAG: hypothetical protein VX730_07645 [Pseudomonadota bacterium]|nr:hypothetical protein [Pseudomonadota bacterium]